ncbi:nuclear receptor subfamily 0 group B member 2-like [Acipenser ruthenus]|uniref:nuclear receptor subfamily 0 group B member 2-like n=1 Tax=Acipenser ruthenus TaxID=7906 RepID=UPI0027404E3F|nr:nuclear receptor subfamily 0 group B member 2-like [Acipenser ruthenus]
MACIEEFYSGCRCSSNGERQPNAILYNILSQKENHSNSHNYSVSQRNCHCEVRRSVCLKTPVLTCQVASDVLVRTVRFMKNLPSFQQLPDKDQLSLLQSGWAPLFILGLAQEGVSFEVTDSPAPSMLKRILLNGQREDSDRAHPTLAGVQRLKSCLNKFWSLDLSPKEYAYLKGAMLFNPDVPGLRSSVFIDSLQQEAQRALREILVPLHPEDRGRFARILLTASTLNTTPPALITELFFRPVIGQADLLELLAEMLLTK